MGIRGQSPLNYFVLQILFCQETFLLKNIAKTEILTPKNVLCARKPLDLGYGSGLSERSKGKQKQTVEQVCTFHDGCKQGIYQQIFNRKSISRKIMHPQFLFHLNKD